MLKKYYIDVSSLPHDQITDIHTKLENFAYIVSEQFSQGEKYHIVGFDVYWDLDEDIKSVINFPENCLIKDFN